MSPSPDCPAGPLTPPSGPAARSADTRERLLCSVKDASDPWDSGFNFVDPVLEAAYWDTRVRRDLWFVDTTSHCNCALMAMGLLPPLRAAAAPAYLTSGLLPAWIAFRAGLSLWSFEGGKAYLVWRTHAIAAVRILFAFLGLVIGWFVPPPEPTPWAVALRVVTGSMVIGLVATSVGLQVKSSVSVRIQFVATVLSMLTVPSFCDAGLGAPRFAPAFQAIGTNIDGFLRYALFGLLRWELGERGPGPEAYSCWTVVAFMQWAVGFLLTSTVVYCIEGWSRICFVASSVEGEGGGGGLLWSRLRARWVWSAATAVGVACVAAASIWELLRLGGSPGLQGSCGTLAGGS